MTDELSRGGSARELFPAGLAQPPGSFRFGMDILLLAAYAGDVLRQREARRGGVRDASPIVELGCGCGAGLLAFCLDNPHARAVGVEREEVLLDACRRNIANLGLEERICAINADVELGIGKIPCADVLLVMANPPWLGKGQGRPPRWHLRGNAMVGSGLRPFCAATSSLLRHHGYFCIILPPALLPELCVAGAASNLGLREILPVASFAGQGAFRLLCFCRKNAAAAPRLAMPLVLHERCGGQTRWRREALSFCHWLGKGRGKQCQTPI